MLRSEVLDTDACRRMNHVAERLYDAIPLAASQHGNPEQGVDRGV